MYSPAPVNIIKMTVGTRSDETNCFILSVSNPSPAHRAVASALWTKLVENSVLLAECPMWKTRGSEQGLRCWQIELWIGGYLKDFSSVELGTCIAVLNSESCDGAS
jgi:hypothetical protein